MEKDMKCLPLKLVKCFCSAAARAAGVISTFQPAFLRLLKKHLCEDINVSLRTSVFTRERRDDDGVALAALRGMQEPTVWQRHDRH